MQSNIKKNIITIKRANENDLEKIIELANNAKSIIRPNNKMIYYLACNVINELTYVSVYQEKVVGYFFAIPVLEKKIVWLHQIVVENQLRGQGIGTKMLNKLKEIVIKSKIYEGIELGVNKDNPAISLYKKLGYLILSEIDEFDMLKMGIKLHG